MKAGTMKPIAPLIDSEDTKRRVEQVAKPVSGVTSLKNEPQVKGG